MFCSNLSWLFYTLIYDFAAKWMLKGVRVKILYIIQNRRDAMSRERWRYTIVRQFVRKPRRYLARRNLLVGVPKTCGEFIRKSDAASIFRNCTTLIPVVTPIILCESSVFFNLLNFLFNVWYKRRYYTLGHFLFSIFLKLLLAEIWKKNKKNSFKEW